MSFFELAFLVGSVALVIFISGGLGYLFGISAWYFVVPVGFLLFLLVRRWGERAMGKSREKFPKKGDEE
jgi:hypothetical protein